MSPLVRPMFLMVLVSGCGTIANVTAPAEPMSGSGMCGPTVCEPFGGVQRSIAFGAISLMCGPIGIVPSVVAVSADAPLSLAGDVITLPIVYARLHAASGKVKDSTP